MFGERDIAWRELRMRGRPWGPNDRTGGALDRLVDELRGGIDGLVVERLVAKYPADDDNVFFLRVGPGSDTHPHGQPPFHLESDLHGPVQTADVAEAVAIASAWLQGRPSPA
jgi:hypothetical protein